MGTFDSIENIDRENNIQLFAEFSSEIFTV